MTFLEGMKPGNRQGFPTADMLVFCRNMPGGRDEKAHKDERLNTNTETQAVIVLDLMANQGLFFHPRGHFII